MKASFALPNQKNDLRVLVSPAVIMTIVNTFQRRNKLSEQKQSSKIANLDGTDAQDSASQQSKGTDRVIGTLLGIVQDKQIQVKTCFVIPHQDGELVQIDIVHQKSMVQLHQKVNPSYQIVGWFSTKFEQSTDVLFHDFYSGQDKAMASSNNPIYMVLDLGVDNISFPKFDIKAFSGNPLLLSGERLTLEFQPIQVDINFKEIEKLGTEQLFQKDSDIEQTSASNFNLAPALFKLRDTLQIAQVYVNEVLQGQRQGDAQIGRMLSETLSSVPKLSKQSFENMFNDGIQEILLVIYLAKLVRMQVSIADRLGTLAFGL